MGITDGVFEGTFGGTDTASNDWYVLIGDTGGVRQLNAAVGGTDGFNFLEIFYSIDSDVTLNGGGTGHRFAVNGNSPAESFPASQQGLIPTTAGAHSFVIDIAQLNQAGDEIDLIRWDPWNVTDDLNRGTAFTIDRVTFGTELVAIPEPAASVLMVLGLGMFTLRRQK